MFYRPPEWLKNKVIWLAWPYDKKLWGADLAQAQDEFIALTKAMSLERLTIICPSETELKCLKGRLPLNDRHQLLVMPYGDIWLRDTFPIQVRSEGAHNRLVIPTFNGWGHKYLFKADQDLSLRAAKFLSWPSVTTPLVFEGGAIECDGQGTMLTTEQCLLNENRNKGWSKAQVEAELNKLFGVHKVIWLKEGLINDHTDGHIDTIARFIGPATVAVMVPKDKSDPNFAVLEDIRRTLERESAADGTPLKILALPSPGAIMNAEGRLMPASYLNFIIGDISCPLPIYGSPFDQEAIDVLADYFDLSVEGLMAKAILSGGGAFHCLSQEFYY